jgi:quercetin dioxygenase-like cupin family protein
VTAPGQGKSIKLFAVRFDYKVTSADSGGDLAALEVTIPPRTLVKPHNHAREDEYTVVLAGTVGARVGDQVVEAGAGASLVKPRGTPHAMWNAAAEPATVLEILSPAAWRTTSRSWSATTGSSSSPRPVAGPGAPGSRPGPG